MPNGQRIRQETEDRGFQRQNQQSFGGPPATIPAEPHAVSQFLRCRVAIVAMPYRSSCDAASHTLGLPAGTIGGPSRNTAWPAALPSSWAGLIFRPQTWLSSLGD